jgi:hypothetical protein
MVQEMAFNYNGKRNDEIEWMSRMAKLPPELLFMHEMMFSEDEKVDNIDLECQSRRVVGRTADRRRNYRNVTGRGPGQTLPEH